MTWVMTLFGRLPICWRLVIMSDDSNSFSTNKKARVVSLSQWEDSSEVFWPMRGRYTDNLPRLHHNYSSGIGLKGRRGKAFKLYQKYVLFIFIHVYIFILHFIQVHLCCTRNSSRVHQDCQNQSDIHDDLHRVQICVLPESSKSRW